MKRSLRSWLWRAPLDEEVDEELAFHLEMRTRELVASGMDPKTAREAARGRMGDFGQLRRTCIDAGRKRDREMRIAQLIQEFTTDVRFALRQLRTSPGFTLVAVLTLALGVGANSAMFALADAVLLRPLPFAAAERLVMVAEHGAQQGGRSRIELLNLGEWATRNRTFEAMAGIWIPAAGGGPTMIAEDGTPETVSAQMVTARFFDVLGVPPIAGRTFMPEDESARRAVAVLSEGFWRRRFAGDPSIVGRDITFEGGPVTVIGVMPARFHFSPSLGFDSSITSPAIWTLLPQPRANEAGPARGQCGVCRLLQVVGRLKPDVTAERGRADLTAIADSLAAQTDNTARPRRVTVTSLRESMLGRDLPRTAILLLGVVAFVLLLCATNVANLVVSRQTSRIRELAVRSALGAGRRRIFGQLLTESLVLASLGGLAGLGLGTAIVSAAPAWIPAGIVSGAITVVFDGRIAAVGAVIALGAGALFGLIAGWHVTGDTLSRALVSESRSATGRGGLIRSVIVVAEVAVAVVVMCSAGLLLRTFLVVDGFDTGYRAERERLLAIDFAVPALSPESRYPTPETLLRFYDGVESDVAAIPGVRAAAWASTLPLGGSQLGQQSFEIVGETRSRASERPQADYQIVSPSYFRALDLPMVAGRAFTDRDTSEGPPVAIVNEAFVRRYLPGRNPLGERISIASRGIPAVREIVGVARQVKGRPDEVEDFVQLYVPSHQSAWPEAYLIVRAVDGEADRLAPAVRQAIARVDKLLPVSRVMTLEHIAREATARHRFRALFVSTFASLALLLALIGVFGVLAYSVQQRTREFGVRIALGATSADVLGLVLDRAARMIGAGALIGLVLSVMVAQMVSSFLFGVEPTDPLTLAAVVTVLAVAATLAAAIPALRASRVDPVEAFKVE